MPADFTIDGHRATLLYFRAGDEAVCVSAQGHVRLEPVTVLDGRRTALLGKLASDAQIASALAEAESIASANGLTLQRDQVYFA